eukprot:TRINITY_DN3078_c0_g1_i3.p1 TRINITY_DN3078_c0_g1~~TRINITY_DN3078_c0_g1_i3.p1  ORF type:complete len:434 (+),score=33.28 TRINITY_DN3078_c0_g1_i3:498-1799(+)
MHLLRIHGARTDSVAGNGDSLLHLSCLLSDSWYCRYFIVEGIPLEKRNQKGETPLFVASRAGNIGVFRLLLRKGASLDARDVQGATPFTIATGEVKAFLSGAFAKNPRKYLEKPEWTPLRNYSIMAKTTAIYGVTVFLLLWSGWLSACALCLLLTYGWYYHGDFPHIDERTTFYFMMVNLTCLTNAFVWWRTLYPASTDTERLVHCVYALDSAFAFGLAHFLYQYTSQPGVIRPDRQVDQAAFLEEIRNDHTVSPICASCRIRRPLRSKHDQFTDKCIAKFDHFCYMTNYPVGTDNHFWFVFGLANTLFNTLLFVYLAWKGLDSFTWHMAYFDDLDRLLLFALVLSTYFGQQQLFAFVMQLNWISKNLTFNESMNYSKYAHFHEGNPFDLGLVENWKEFLTRQRKLLWFETYSLTELNNRRSASLRAHPPSGV